MFARMMLIGFLGLTALRSDASETAIDTWIYTLRLVPRLHDEKAWTVDDNKVVAEHFAHLQRLTARRVVVLAGRTMEPGASTFGIVIFEAANEEAARETMAADPAVRGKVMTASVHPFSLALQRKD